MGRKTPPYPEYEDWTTAKFWSFIRSALRKAHTRWPPAQNVMKKDRRVVTGKRHKYEHKCAKCDKWFPQPQIEKDHIVPTGTLRCADDLKPFVMKMFVREEGYRKLCKPCHKEVTLEERKANKNTE